MNRFWRSASRRRTATRRGASIPISSLSLESLEARQLLAGDIGGALVANANLLATYTVTSTADTVNATDGVLTLREAIQQANASNGPDEIAFNIPGPGPYSIRPLSPLPEIDDPVVIDGATQPGFTGTPIIELDGSLAGVGASADGLFITAGASTVRGLVINRFAGNGIHLSDNGGNVIVGNFIGLDLTGTQARGNGADGVFVANSPDNRIGGTTAQERNVISGNDSPSGDGIELNGNLSTGNEILGNYLGTDVTGLVAVPNDSNGIEIDGAITNLIGGEDPGAGNLISGNGSDGIELRAASMDITIQGNFIGVDRTGAAPLGNGNDGLSINAGSVQNLVGGNTPAAANVISGNIGDGIELNGADTIDNRVRGNLIGVDAGGTFAVPNGSDGIEIQSAVGNTIGGTTPGAGNVISGNTSDGIELADNASGNRIQGNLIGLDITGAAPLGNARRGVYLDNGANNNTIGGVAEGEANQIAHNQEAGVYLRYDAGNGNSVRGNAIFGNLGLSIDLVTGDATTTIEGPTP
ncbi:MAG: right-handed parallel beta-helix repeat-containing protein, partial [Planctomycetales bacterium]|nr:right-handed parallel beta-helix repeat-containing protein [Planctomycetales bacterium]